MHTCVCLCVHACSNSHIVLLSMLKLKKTRSDHCYFTEMVYGIQFWPSCLISCNDCGCMLILLLQFIPVFAVSLRQITVVMQQAPVRMEVSVKMTLERLTACVPWASLAACKCKCYLSNGTTLCSLASDWKQTNIYNCITFLAISGRVKFQSTWANLPCK